MHLFLRPFLLAAAIVAGSALVSCRHEADPIPEPLQPGVVTGVVQAQDELGNPESAAGVAITLQGGATPLSVTTDATGKFEFNNLPLGTYEATFTRNDLGITLSKNLVLDTRNAMARRTIIMGRPATTTVTGFTLTGTAPFPNSIPYTLDVSFNPAIYPNGYFYELYLSDKPSVSNTDYLLNYASSSNQNPAKLWISTDNLKAKGIASGSTVYVVAQGAAIRPTSYENYSTGNSPVSIVITNLNPVRSLVRSFVMP